MRPSVEESFILTASPVGCVELLREVVGEGAVTRTRGTDAALLRREAMRTTSGFVLLPWAVDASVADAAQGHARVCGGAPEFVNAAPRPHRARATRLVTSVSTVLVTVADFELRDALVRRQALELVVSTVKTCVEQPASAPQLVGAVGAVVRAVADQRLLHTVSVAAV